jgi:hypothetical protein
MTWFAEARVFSGRPDPGWEVPPSLAGALTSLWEALPADGETPSPPPLGYRGCVLRDPGGREWAAYGGVVRLSVDGALRETRRDPGRVWERRLLASAPPGLLPPDLP